MAKTKPGSHCFGVLIVVKPLFHKISLKIEQIKILIDLKLYLVLSLVYSALIAVIMK